VEVGGAAGDEGDVLAQGFGEQVGGVDVVGQRRPEEEPALGPNPGRLLGKVPIEGGEHRLPTGPVDLDEVGDVAAPAALAEVLADEVLAERRGGGCRGLLAEADLLQHGWRGGDPADPDARGEDLGEGAEVEDVVAPVEAVEG